MQTAQGQDMDLILYRIIRMLKEGGYNAETLEILQFDLRNGDITERDCAYITWGWVKSRLDCDMMDFDIADHFISQIDQIKDKYK